MPDLSDKTLWSDFGVWDYTNFIVFIFLIALFIVTSPKKHVFCFGNYQIEPFEMIVENLFPLIPPLGQSTAQPYAIAACALTVKRATVCSVRVKCAHLEIRKRRKRSDFPLAVSISALSVAFAEYAFHSIASIFRDKQQTTTDRSPSVTTKGVEEKRDSKPRRVFFFFSLPTVVTFLLCQLLGPVNVSVERKVYAFVFSFSVYKIGALDRPNSRFRNCE